MASPLLQTKLYIHPAQPGLVHRPRLTSLINEGLPRKLTLVSAPPGFGKTTLLSEWIPTSRRCVAWLSLEEAENDPIRFWNYVIAALQTLQEDLAESCRSFLSAEGQQAKPISFEAMITALLNDVSDFPDEFALVLDDYHHINNSAIHQGIMFLIEHLPPRMHIIIASRADPPLPLARLRARGELIELRSDDLRFTAEEAAEFLNRTMNLDLAADHIAALEGRTEGWIVGLQLAALSLQKHEDAARFIASFKGSHRFILDYLMDEVLNHKPDDVQSFLLRTSILGRFTGRLCDSVTGAKNGQQMLWQLEQDNLFVTPLDSQRSWYRYHHLFADLLRRRLQELMPDQVQTLHERACDWFEREGLLPEAIDHAIAMRGFERSAQLIERVAESQRQSGEIATLTGWVNALPLDVRRDHPALCLAYARALADSAQNVLMESWIQDAEAGLSMDKVRSNAAFVSLQGQAAAMRAYLAMVHHAHAEAIELARRARELLGQEETRWRSFVGAVLAGAYRFTNDWAAAADSYLEASNLSQALGDKVNALSALSLRGEVLEAQGQLHEAADQFEHVLQLARNLAMPDAPVTGYALVGLGRTWYEWNDLSTAQRYVERGLEQGRQSSMQDLALRGQLALARILQARGDFRQALDALDNAEPAARQIGMADIQDWIGAIRAQIWLASGESGAAIAWASAYAGNLNDAVFPSMAVALAKARLAEGKPGEALRLLEHALQSARSVGRLGNAIQILAVQASVQQALGDRENAFAALSQALTLAAPEGYLRPFLDEGPLMRSLITEYRTAMKVPSHRVMEERPKEIFSYTDRLLNAFPAASVSNPHQASIADPLTEREVVVLRLMAAGLSSRDIADRNTVSINTVKSQVRSIYGKLGAHTRKDAVSAGRNLGLLS